jgi:hypothetical protein
MDGRSLLIASPDGKFIPGNGNYVHDGPRYGTLLWRRDDDHDEGGRGRRAGIRVGL